MQSQNAKLKDANNITQSETCKKYELCNCMYIHNSSMTTHCPFSV